ncbi:hypothetical protein IB265_31995 [Ensifer sp. ENS10]|uniref:hypothetical protein n=1 Tax=Ensifer sp. ENS10 TaxID=2769286 RepID=UPI0017873038|nr:hypothetical protein [Ensifer sp. ENS10]MBD9511388.1 hypothetical protein [Ensifer sp. ENS10]
MVNDRELKGIVWWSCFLESHDRIYDHISSIGEQLLLRGQQLVVIGPAGDYSRCVGFFHIAVPFSIVEQGRKFSNLPGPSVLPMTATALPELMEAERLWSHAPNSFDTEFSILRALRYWEKIFEIMRPSVILTWGSTLPFSKLLMRLAQITQTPCYAAERGLTEDTLMVNLLGQCQISNIGLRLSFIEPAIPAEEVEREWGSIESYYRSLTIRNYALSNKSVAFAGVDAPADGGPIVLYLGAFDVGSGMSFDSVRAGDRYANWIRHSGEGARAVASSLQRSFAKATLLVKPHPATSFHLHNDFEGVNVVNCHDQDFRLLLSQCDACVTPISTTQIYGFIYDKPVVTLANGFFAGRDITYEAVDDGSLDRALSAAVGRVGWDEKRSRAKSLITALFREEFVGLSDDLPGRLKASHLVEHLARFVNYRHPSTEGAAKRIQQFNAFRAWTSPDSGNLSADEIKFAIGQENWENVRSELAADFVDETLKRMADGQFSGDGCLAATERLLQHVQETIDLLVRERIQLEEEKFEVGRVAQEEQVASLAARCNDLESALANAVDLRQVELAQRETIIQRLNAELNDVARKLDKLEERLEVVNEDLQSTIEDRRALESRIGEIDKERHLLSTWVRESLKRRKMQREGFPYRILQGTRAKELKSEFNPVQYLLANPDVACAGLDPDFHWERFGRKEGRTLKSPGNDEA